MNNRNRNYWIEQAKNCLLQNEKQTDKYVHELLQIYDEAANEIEKEIQAMFGRYAENNGLTNAEASKLISGNEYNKWRMSVEQYMKEGAVKGGDSKILRELNTLSAKSRISRKEQLLGNIYKNIIQMTGDTATKLESLLGDMLRTNYYRSIFDIQRGLGVGWQVAKIPEKLVKQVLEYPWSQKHFSRALWDDVDKVAALARREISIGFVQGSSVQKMARGVNEVMDKGRYAAERLIRTECKYFANEGSILGYRENGITRYRFVGSTEGSVRCDCSLLNGKEFDIDDAVAGVNLPPIHPNCLCTIITVFAMSIFDDDRKVIPLAENSAFERWRNECVS